MNIPSGYQVIVTSWENDLDHVKSTTTRGLNIEDTKAVIWLVSHFKRESTNSNTYVSEEFLVKLHNEFKAKFCLSVSDQIRARFVCYEDDPEEIAIFFYDALATLLGYTVDYEDEPYFMRVTMKVEVYYFPEEIKDVTSHFDMY